MSHSPAPPQMIIPRLICSAFLGIFMSASCVLADGLFLPELAVEKIPTMPVQRGVILWKNGVETLILSSSLDSEARKLGWIIPVPATLQKIEQQTPGGVKTLVSCIQPRITDDLGWEVAGLIVVALAGNIFLAILMFKRQWLSAFLAVLFVIVLLAAVTVPLSKTGNESLSLATAVHGEKTANVGSYDTTVLMPKESAELDTWLKENGLAPLPPGGDQLIAEYIKGGWMFAAVTLARTEAGASTPPPVDIVFETKEAVYPLRLGALAGGRTAFEIFVLADQRASCELLKSDFCDQFESRMVPEEPLPFYQGAISSVCIGNPSIRRMMWNGCVLTKLAGTIDADKMTADIRLAWKPFQSVQDQLYTKRGAFQCAAFYFAWFAGTWACLSMLVCKRWIWQPKGGRWYVGVVLLPAIVLCAIGAVLFYANLPRLKPSDVRVIGNADEYDSGYLHARIFRIIQAHPDLLKKTQPEIIDVLLAQLSPPESQLAKGVKPTQNQATGGPIAVEDSPGNFTLEKQDDAVLIRVYDRFGQSWAIAYPITGSVEEQPKSVRERHKRK